MTSQSPGADSKPPPRANLLLPWEIVVAPARAFERIAASPEWVLAYGIIIVLTTVSAIIAFPASSHVLTILHPALKPELKLHPRDLLANFVIIQCAMPLISIVLTTGALTIFAGLRDFKKMFAYSAILSLVTNCALIAALGNLLQAIAILFHPASSFTDARSLDGALPVTLTMLASPGNPAQADFLSNFGIFSLWSDIVLAFGFAKLTNSKLVPSLIFVLALSLLMALLFLS